MARSRTMIILMIILAGMIAPPVHAAYSPVAGGLVKGSLAAVYYVTADGKRMAFPNEATYFSWYPDFSGVKIIADSDLAALPLFGLATIRPGTKIVKFETDPKTYAVAHGGTLRSLISDAIIKMIYGADWAKKLSVVPDAFQSSYKFGIDVTGPGQYWWARERDASPNIASDLDAKKSPDAIAPAAPAATTPPTVASPAATTPAAVADPSTKNILFVLWDPKRPSAAAPDRAALERAVFGGTPSVVDYFHKESNDKVHIVNAGILGWYSADYPPDHYWSDDAYEHRIDAFKTGEAERYSEALSKSDADFDYKKYDINNDGTLSPDELSIIVVIPQYGDPVDGTATVSMNLDGVAISSIGTLYVSTPLASAPEFGTIAHCFAKFVFGAQDISASNGAFSLMSDSRSDLLLDPSTRINLGWLTPKRVTKVQEISAQDIPANGSAIRIDRDQPGGSAVGNEYFLIENRERDIYDNALPDTGLAVWDVNGSRPSLVRFNSTTSSNDTEALWHLQSDPLANTAQELHWTDGARSGVRMLGIGAAGPVMSITLENRIITLQDLVPLPSPIQGP